MFLHKEKIQQKFYPKYYLKKIFLVPFSTVKKKVPDENMRQQKKYRTL